MSFSSAPWPDEEQPPGSSHKQSLTCLFEIADYLQRFDLSFLMNQQWHICPSNDFCSVSIFSSGVSIPSPAMLKILLTPVSLQQVKLAETRWWLSSCFQPCTYLPLQASYV